MLPSCENTNATPRPPPGAAGFKLPDDAFRGLDIDELRWTNAELQTEALRQIRSIVRTITPEDLTHDECADLLALLKSFVDRRGDVL